MFPGSTNPRLRRYFKISAPHKEFPYPNVPDIGPLSPSNPCPNLPPELWAMIIKFVTSNAIEDKSLYYTNDLWLKGFKGPITVRKCSLVSSQWRTLCLPHLFREIRFNSRPSTTLLDFFEVLRSSNVGPYVQKLHGRTIYGHDQTITLGTEILCQVVQRLPHLRCLNLDGIRFYSDISFEHTLALEEVQIMGVPSQEILETLQVFREIGVLRIYSYSDDDMLQQPCSHRINVRQLELWRPFSPAFIPLIGQQVTGLTELLIRVPTTAILRELALLIPQGMHCTLVSLSITVDSLPFRGFNDGEFLGQHSRATEC